MMRECRQWKELLGRMYAGATGVHRWFRSRQDAAPIPVLVVGSLRSGGGGKTPVATWLAHRFPDAAVLAHPTGDEDQELQQTFPGRVFLGDCWRELWETARQAGFRTGICDGGFQDPAMQGAFKLLIWDEPEHWGYESLLPVGRFRELPSSLRRADLVLAASDSVPVDFHGRTWSFAWAHDPLPDRIGSEALLACGVGRPERVRHDLEAMGIRVRASHIVPDHGKFSVRSLEALARMHPGLPWVGTSKDAVRWPKGLPALAVMKRRWVPEEPQSLLELLERELALRRLPATANSVWS